MQLGDLLLAVALMLIIEGIMPFVNPAALRRMLLAVARLDDQTLRFGGLTAIVVGYLLFNLAV
ncbi:MAG: DUF2065 domain-containing protein [Gammaproteobacteria bacterium]|nr:DUF2065 domain-containing protein [Gammaproteobacteria bacterium]